MPNIQIFGLQSDMEDMFGESRVNKVSNKIRQLFEEKPYRDDYVITNVLSEVNLHREEVCSPFLRICTTNSEGELEDILNTLAVLNMDMEVLILQRFIPKKS